MTPLEIITYFVIAGLIGLGWLYIAAVVTNKKEEDYTHDDFQEWNDRMDAISDFYMKQPLMKDANKSWDEYSARNHKGRRL